jgi:hypothetical protein
MSITAMKEMANYIDALGGDSKKYHQAIEQAEKPVACAAEIVADVNGTLSTRWANWWTPNEGDKLYTTPPAAQRKPLTNGEIYTAYVEAANQTLRPQDERIAFAFARAIEAAHGIKE